MDIIDISYNADGSTTVTYSDGTSKTTFPNGTGNGNGYTTGGGGSDTPGYTNPATGGKKWWEVALGVFPAIITGLFGNNANANQYPVNQYPTGTGTNTGGMNTNMILIIAVAAIVVILFMKKK
ncbi:hypothetical protein [Dyadobacter aurulentus]|uniref:hypothetical protein n=1 Tax=Dyadobacter sp. UC 10 TaxID=2605428 RepID=UPI0011F1ED96|nr:hypothetical protein [Dyadobacter sp. UC 10]KAA0992768.1 hypothetical protein FXO21_22615 [Dyadobacter sp. UC 10]